MIVISNMFVGIYIYIYTHLCIVCFYLIHVGMGKLSGYPVGRRLELHREGQPFVQDRLSRGRIWRENRQLLWLRVDGLINKLIDIDRYWWILVNNGDSRGLMLGYDGWKQILMYPVGELQNWTLIRLDSPKCACMIIYTVFHKRTTPGMKLIIIPEKRSRVLTLWHRQWCSKLLLVFLYQVATKMEKCGFGVIYFVCRREPSNCQSKTGAIS